MIVLLLSAGLIAATLERAASELDQVYISSYLTQNDVKRAWDIKRVMTKSALEDGDLVGHLSVMLRLPRDAAIDHFIAHNLPELEEIVELQVAEAVETAPNDLVLASILTSGVLPPALLVRLQALIEQYIYGKLTICLYDHLPMVLRDPVEYEKVFKRVENYRVIPEPNDGVIVTLPDDDSPVNTDTSSIGRGILLQRIYGGVAEEEHWKSQNLPDRFFRVVDVNGRCAVDLVHPYREVQFDLQRRAIFALLSDGAVDYLDIWRANSISATRLESPCLQAPFASITEDGRFYCFVTTRMLTNNFYFAKRQSQEAVLTCHLMPVDLDRPGQLQVAHRLDIPPLIRQVVQDQVVLRDAAGSLSVLSAKGHQRLLMILQATDGAIKEKRDALNALVIRNQYRATREQHAALMVSDKQSSIASWLKHMKGLGDITCIPLENWDAWYIDYLGRLAVEGF